MMIDSNYDKDAPQKNLSDRAFGCVFSLVFLIVALSPLLHGNRLHWWALFLTALLLATACFRPTLLSTPNRVWMAFGNVMHRLVSLVVLMALFFGVVMPCGLILRLFRHDPLRLHKEPDAETYWIDRPLGSPTSNMHKQY